MLVNIHILFIPRVLEITADIRKDGQDPRQDKNRQRQEQRLSAAVVEHEELAQNRGHGNQDEVADGDVVAFFNVANEHDDELEQHEEAGDFLDHLAEQVGGKWAEDHTANVEDVAEHEDHDNDGKQAEQNV